MQLKITKFGNSLNQLSEFDTYGQDVMKSPHECFKDNLIFSFLLYQEFQEICSFDPEFLHHFDSLKSYNDKTCLLLTNKSSLFVINRLHDHLMKESSRDDVSSVKNSQDSHQHRLSGNQYFNLKNYEKALSSYNMVSINSSIILMIIPFSSLIHNVTKHNRQS